VLHRGTRADSVRDAAQSTGGFVAVAAGFGIALSVLEGHDAGAQFFA
jgi:hypothetical protein